MATTTGGSTYVLSTDLVADDPTASLSLANRVDVVASGGPGLVKTAGYTITVADILGGNKFLYNSASPGTFTLPTSSLVDGMVVNVAQIGAGALTVSGGTIVGTTVTTAQYQGLRFVYVASGTTWYSIAPFATAPSLAIVEPTSIANSGGTSSKSGGAVTFTGVTSISLNGIFTALYDNYIAVIEYSGGGTLTSRYRTAGTDNSTANYSSAGFFANQVSVGVETASCGTGLTVNRIGGVPATRAGNTIQIYSPFLAAPTSHTSAPGTADAVYRGFMGQFSASTSFDGMTFITSSTMTGTIRFYGLKNS
jgi:hypothetical protein